MKNEFENIIASLRGDNSEEDLHNTPDGVIDISHIVRSLKSITRNGRAVESDEPGAVPAMLGNWINRDFGDGTDESKDRCIVALNMLIVLIFRQVQIIKPDLCPEEILMEVCDHESLESIAVDMQATEYRNVSSDEIAIAYFQHEIFHKAFKIDDLVKHSFNRRRITPSHFSMLNDPVELNISIVEESEVKGTEKEPDTSATSEKPKNYKVNLNDLEGLMSDPLNGFDDFYEYFFQSDNLLLELGVDFDDLPPFNSSGN
jgi:hypothetical protein